MSEKISIDGGLPRRFDDHTAGIAEIHRRAVDDLARRMVGAHQRNAKAAEIGRATGIHRIEVLQASRNKPHAEIVIRRHRRTIRLGDVERIADMVAMAVREHDVFDALARCRFVGDEGRITGEKWIDQDRVAGKVESESGMAKPGDLHGGTSSLRDAGRLQP
jgi:hypothetical protein